MSVKTRTLSARRARKAPKLKVATDREVTDVTAQLRKGTKTLGKATLAKLTSSATLKFKLRKALKPGRYTVAVAAKQGDRTVGVTAPLRVRR